MKIKLSIKFISIAIYLMISAVNCAKLIPLAYEPQESSDFTNSNSRSSFSRQLQQSPVYDNNENRRIDYVDYEVINDPPNLDAVATLTPSTDVELSSNYRDPRKMRQEVSTEKPRKSKNKEGLMAKILPMLVMPFLVSSSLIPMMLTSLKFMLLKSLFVGKIAIVLLALNALWKSDNRGGVYSHNVNLEHEQKELHKSHYGYNGDEEYGAYVNRRMGRKNEFR